MTGRRLFLFLLLLACRAAGRRGDRRPVIVLFKIAARAFGNENVSVNLHHLRLRKPSALVQVVHVLGDQQKFIRTLRQFGNRFMGGIRLRISNALAPLAIPLPN